MSQLELSTGTRSAAWIGILAGAVVAWPMAQHAAAEPIRFIHQGFASGSIIGDDPFATRISFGPSAFTIDAIADTDDRQDLIRSPGGDPYGYDITHRSVTLTIDGMGTYELLVPTRTYVVHGEGDARVGFGMAGRFAPPDLFNGPMLSGLADWDMTTSITGSAPSGGLVFQWDAAEVMTDEGRVLFNFLSSSDWDFEAIVVPTPASGVFMLGLFGAVSRRRRQMS